MTNTFHLAQLNIADAKADSSSDIMQGFYDRLDEIHVLAENAPGFIWRYQDEEEDVSVEHNTQHGSEKGAEINIAQKIFDNPLLLINITLWQDVATLRHFVYKTVHKELIQSREEWFHTMPEMHQVLWWVKAGHIPSIQESKDKLDLLRSQGPTADAFTFAKPFDPK